MKCAFFALFILFSQAQASNFPVRLGDSTVIIQLQQQGRGKMFVHLHQNETTALKAAKKIIETDGGHLLTLVHAGQRNIVFNLHHKRYEFDPNRIFTDVGIRKTLMQFGGYTPAAHHQVSKLAVKIKKLLPPHGKIIAVHNNRTYSLKDYLRGHHLAQDARSLNFYDKSHYRNFYMVTKNHDYLRLKRLNFNSVWQAKAPIDDGSLSVYLAQRDYINVEAGYDQLTAQIKMLQYA